MDRSQTIPLQQVLAQLEEEAVQDIPKEIGILQKAGYNGTWGIESTPNDGDELGAARKTLALLKRVLE